MVWKCFSWAPRAKSSITIRKDPWNEHPSDNSHGSPKRRSETTACGAVKIESKKSSHVLQIVVRCTLIVSKSQSGDVAIRMALSGKSVLTVWWDYVPKWRNARLLNVHFGSSGWGYEILFSWSWLCWKIDHRETIGREPTLPVLRLRWGSWKIFRHADQQNQSPIFDGVFIQKRSNRSSETNH